MKLIICFFILFVVYSCTNSGYYFGFKERVELKEKYELEEIYLNDYIMYGSQYQRTSNPKYGRISLKSDSLFNLFKDAVSNLGLPVEVNKNNSNRMSGKFLKYNELDHKYPEDKGLAYIISVVGDTQNKTVMVPLISKLYERYWAVNSAGSDTYPYFICRMYFTVFLVRNKEIIYSKQLRYVETIDSEFHDFEFHDFHIPIPQKHWDGLFREVMKEYIQRLEWEGC